MNEFLKNAGSRKDGQRILALWFPYLATERILRQRLGRSWRSGRIVNHSSQGREQPDRMPLIISHLDRNAQRIFALDERAEALGLKPGMGIADARAMHPEIDVVEADPQADMRLLEGLADWCDRYTPLVAMDGTAGLFLDITGCAHLFGGEQAMLDGMVERFFQQGFVARAAIASTVGAAWAASRFSSGLVLAVGAEEKFLAPLPLSALRIEPGVRESLEGVGLRRLGAVMTTPRGPLARRFGTSLLRRLDEALGRLDEAVSPRLPTAPLSVERHLAEPVTQIEDIERLTTMLAQALKGDLERRGEGARSLGLMLFRVDGAVSRIAVGTSRPLRDPALIRKLFHERFAAIRQDFDAGYGFDLVRLAVLAVGPFSNQQTDLAGQASEGREQAGVEMFADRVRARLGETAVLKPVPVESHLPERAIALVPFAQALPKKPARMKETVPPPAIRRQRPVRLFRSPEPIEVPATELPEGPPLHFRWRRALYKVARAEGPERIAPEWWRPGVDQEAPTRDYFRIEDAEGRRYWLFRQGLYEAAKTPPRWFMHGIFA